MKEVCLSVFIETLTEASFDITFTSTLSPPSDPEGGTSDTDRPRVDGNLFLRELDIALRERALQSFFPLRCCARLLSGVYGVTSGVCLSACLSVCVQEVYVLE